MLEEVRALLDPTTSWTRQGWNRLSLPGAHSELFVRCAVVRL